MNNNNTDDKIYNELAERLLKLEKSMASIEKYGKFFLDNHEELSKGNKSSKQKKGKNKVKNHPMRIVDGRDFYIGNTLFAEVKTVEAIPLTYKTVFVETVRWEVIRPEEGPGLTDIEVEKLRKIMEDVYNGEDANDFYPTYIEGANLLSLTMYTTTSLPEIFIETKNNFPHLNRRTLMGFIEDGLEIVSNRYNGIENY